MIQLVFKSTGKIIPEWENDQERLLFRLTPIRVERSHALHQQIEEAGGTGPKDEAVGVVALNYEDDLTREVQVVLELPDEVWDNLANWADDLLDEDLLPDEDEPEFSDEDWDED